MTRTMFMAGAAALLLTACDGGGTGYNEATESAEFYAVEEPSFSRQAPKAAMDVAPKPRLFLMRRATMQQRQRAQC